MKKRIEVWFNNGLFRAYPNVVAETTRRVDNFMIFEFGADDNNRHVANINLDNVNFVEEMYCKEES